jgi:hypothetical protein
MAKDFNKEPEEKDDVFIDAEYNPLNDPINEKPYTKPNVTIDPEDLKGDIPEPDFTPPPMGAEDNPFEENERPQPIRGRDRPFMPYSTKPRQEPLNPELEGATKKENKKSAKTMAEMLMSGYEIAHKVGNNSLKISEKKIQKLVQEDKISLSMRLPYDEYGNTMSVKELIDEYNDQTGDILKVDPEWKEETMPVLIEVLEKRGIGATPEQQLAFLFTKDIGVKVIQVMSSLNLKKSMINSWTMLYEQNKFGYQQTPQTQSPNQPSTPTPKDETYMETYEVDEYDPLNENMTVTEMEEIDPMSVNYQVEQMTNPDGAKNVKKKGRPKKNK